MPAKAWIFIVAFTLGVSLAGIAAMTEKYNNDSIYAMVQIVPHHREIQEESKPDLPAQCAFISEKSQAEVKKIMDNAKALAQRILDKAREKSERIQFVSEKRCQVLLKKKTSGKSTN